LVELRSSPEMTTSLRPFWHLSAAVPIVSPAQNYQTKEAGSEAGFFK
jgi:hypothetical protein